jgi:hypothetical protein
LKRHFKLTILLILAFHTSVSATHFNKLSLVANNNDFSRASKKPNAIYKKSATEAFVIASVPGFFIHGLGHYYIGDNKTGGWLLASEGASIILFYSALAGLAAHTDCPECHKTGINILGCSGLILFFGSWIIDFVDAPNQLIKKKASLIGFNHFPIKTQKNKIMVNFSYDF